MDQISKHVRNSMILFLLSFLFVFSSAFFDGKRIHSYDELEESFPLMIGFPVPFVELEWSKIDPPLPYFYNIRCCGIEWYMEKFLLSVLCVFVTFLLFYVLIYQFKTWEIDKTK